MVKAFYGCALLFLLTAYSFSFSLSKNELGHPVVNAWLPKHYNAGPSNWAITEGYNKLLYFGNALGVLEFDGSTWRLIQLPNKSVCRSLLSDKHGTVYVGGVNYLGYLKPDNRGQLKFFSLGKKLPKQYQAFNEVSYIHQAKNHIYFTTQKFIFRWELGPNSTHYNPQLLNLKVFKTNQRFLASFEVNNTFYTQETNVGLKFLQGDSLIKVFKKNPFYKNRIATILPEKNRLLITLMNGQTFLNENEVLNKKAFKERTLFNKNPIYKQGKRLNDGSILYNTLGAGVVQVDSIGNIINQFNHKHGLPFNSVTYSYLSKNSASYQWLALENGIARTEINGPFTTFGAKNGLHFRVFNLYRFQNTLYIATTNGIFYFDTIQGKFKDLNIGYVVGFDMLETKNQLLIATSQGLFSVQNKKAKKIDIAFKNGTYPTALLQSKINKGRVFVGLKGSIASIIYKNKRWHLEGFPNVFTNEIRTLAEDSAGNIWAGTMQNGALRFSFKTLNSSLWRESKLDLFKEKQGLVNGNVSLVKVDNSIVFTTDSSAFRFDKITQNFIPDTSFEKGKKKPGWFMLKQQSPDTVWVLGNGLARGIKGKNGQYTWLKKPFNRLYNYIVKSAWFDKNGIIWFGSANGLVRFDMNKIGAYKHPFSTLLRKVTIGNDSLLFAGAGKMEPTLDYNLNNIKFEFSANSYQDRDKMVYRTRLLGFNANWSAWSNESFRSYTNLSEDKYIFEVEARNIFGNIGRKAQFNFTVLAPYYRSWWAYVLYVFISLIIFAGLLHIRVKALKKKNEALEVLVAERTKEISSKNLLLKNQTEELKELDQLKTRFFSNISHEFRTPLTLILGHTDQLLNPKTVKPQLKQLDSIKKNANRLLNLINQLLYIAKLESNNLKIKVEKSDIVAITKLHLLAFESMAEQHNIQLQFSAEKAIPAIYLDIEKYERIILNLISNALKFTPANGQVKIEIKKVAFNKVSLTISDTGVGISEVDLPHIFNRFYQADASQTRQYEGTGIGLSLVKDLVKLHQATIDVTSTINQGTTFNILFKTGSNHFEPQQIIDAQTTKNEEAPNVFVSKKFSEPKGEKELSELVKKRVKNSVLIVEDNPDVRQFIKEQLSESFAIQVAENGEVGLQKAINNQPDLMITDLMMPKLDGYQLTKEIRADERTSHIPIIMLTSNATEQSKFKGLETGVDAYLTKPFNANELIIRVNNLIEIRSTLQKRFSKTGYIKPNEVTTLSVDQAFLQRIISTIETNLSQESFSLSELATTANMSISQLNRKLNALIGQPAGKLVRTMRLEKGAELLLNNKGSVSEIAYWVGFADQAHFSRSFKEHFSVAPSKYKQFKNKSSQQ